MGVQNALIMTVNMGVQNERIMTVNKAYIAVVILLANHECF